MRAWVSELGRQACIAHGMAKDDVYLAGPHDYLRLHGATLHMVFKNPQWFEEMPMVPGKVVEWVFHTPHWDDQDKCEECDHR